MYTVRFHPKATKKRTTTDRKMKKLLWKQNEIDYSTNGTSSDSDLSHKFQCEKCNVKFLIKKNLVKHIRLIHSSEVIKECDSYPENKNLFKEKSLIKHQKTFISNILKIKKNDLVTDTTSRCKITCAKCDEIFINKPALIKHIRIFHPKDIKNSVIFSSNKNFTCLNCKSKFLSKPNLVKHTNRFHPEDVNKNRPAKTIKCSNCTAMFSRVYGLNKHLKKFHPDFQLNRCHSQSLKIAQCSACLKMFSRKHTLKRHEMKFHPEKIDQDKSQISKKSVQCPICKDTYSKKKLLLDHFRNVHEIDLQEDFLAFNTENDFKRWKITVEEDTKCNYRIRHSMQDSDYKKILFRCSRSGYYETKAEVRQRKLKKIGSKKINGYCPAEMNVKVNRKRGVVEVYHQGTHVGHTNELKYMDLNEEERNIIVNNLAAGVPVNVLLQKLRIDICTPQEDRKRLHLISKNEIRNVANSAGLYNPLFKVHIKENLTSVEEWVLKNEESVLYYKSENSFDDRFPYLEKGDFILIILTNTQSEKLFQYGNNILYFDSNRGVNYCQFQLSILLVLNEIQKQYPCVFMFSNKIDESIYHVLLQCIKQRIPSLKPKIIMTDMTESFYDAWLQIMPEPEFRLYCTWHVLKEWKSNLSKICSLEIRKLVIKNFDQLLHSANEESFKAELTNFIRPDQGYNEYQKYFMDEYVVKRSPKYWAHCYRQLVNVNINMNLKIFHKNMKYHIYGGNKVKHLNEALCRLDKYLLEKEHEDLLIQEGCIPLNNKIRIIRKRHQQIKNVNIENIECVVDSEVWFVTLSTTAEDSKTEEVPEQNVLTVYSVEKTHADCKTLNCVLKCDDCNTCLHNFKCSCEDYSERGNMCKHIHIVCQYIKISINEYSGDSFKRTKDEHAETSQILELDEFVNGVEKENTEISQKTKKSLNGKLHYLSMLRKTVVTFDELNELQL